MKEFKKIIAAIVILCTILSVCTVVNAAENKITISEGTVNGKVVTYTVTIPQGAGLRGDANDDGVVDALDKTVLNEYVSNTIDESRINKVNSDLDNDGSVGISDISVLQKMTNPYIPVKVMGTLASGATSKIVRTNATTYTVTVTLAEEKEGTVGIELMKGLFNFADHKSSDIAKEETTISKTTTDKEEKPSTEETTYPTSKEITMSEGKQNGNKVTFTVKIPAGLGLRGDVNNDGKINSDDEKLLTEYNNKSTTKIHKLNAFIDVYKDIEVADLTLLTKLINSKYSPISLNGTLAEKAKYEFAKTADGVYSVVVTLPENAEGTIGATLIKDAVVFADYTRNEAIPSKLLTVSKTASTEKEDKKDDTAATTKIPAAGIENSIIFVIAIIAVAAIIGYVKYKNIDK